MRETVAQRRGEIDATLARLRGRIGTLVIRFEAEGLEVRVDGLQRDRQDQARALGAAGQVDPAPDRAGALVQPPDAEAAHLAQIF